MWFRSLEIVNIDEVDEQWKFSLILDNYNWPKGYKNIKEVQLDRKLQW